MDGKQLSPERVAEDRAFQPSTASQPDTVDGFSYDGRAESEAASALSEGTRGEKYFVFSLAETRYAIPFGNLVAVERPPHVTPLPGVPKWLAGVANHGGEIISIVDCRAIFRVDTPPRPDQQCLCIVATGDKEITTGLLVDRMEGLSGLPADQPGSQAGPGGHQVSPYVRGVYEDQGHSLRILNVEKLLRSLDVGR